MNPMSLIYSLVFVPVVLAVLYSAYIIFWLRKQPAGNEKLQQISKAIQEGSKAYLNRQTKTVGIVAAILFLAIGFLLSWETAIAFLVGAVFSV